MGTREPSVPARGESGVGSDPSPPSETSILVAADVNKSFGETWALRSCSFAAESGQVHALVGENGSGKSTLAKVFAGVLPPDSGTVSVNGGTPKSPTTAGRLGLAMVFQEILVADGGSVLDNLFLGHDGLFRAKIPQREKRARARALLDRLTGSQVDLDATIDDLSLSTQQWIVIARALLRKPRVVIFDEATAALDQASVERFFAEVRRLKQSGACVVVVTHRIDEIMAICDHATVLSDGVNMGTLLGDQITEHRLLELMKGAAAGAEREAPAQMTVAETPERAVSSEASADLLSVSDLRLTDRSEAIDLTLRAGEIVGLAGLEGQGQVEFLWALNGINRPVAGEIHVASQGSQLKIDSERAAEHAGIVYISGDRKREGIFPNLSIFENFGLPRYRDAASAGFIKMRKVHRMFDDQARALSIRGGRLNDSINSLSGGNQQKIVIGRSLAASPLVIALNDPTRGVDIATKRDLYGLLRALAEKGKAILFLSNEIEEFEGLCDRVAVFRSGSIFTTLSSREVTEGAVLPAMFGRIDQIAGVEGERSDA
jgi:ABC-type sugar transport system ATPase subunit